MRFIYTPKGMSKKFGVHVIYQKYGISFSLVFLETPCNLAATKEV
jgi:hypothetical protein